MSILPSQNQGSTSSSSASSSQSSPPNHGYGFVPSDIHQSHRIPNSPSRSPPSGQAASAPSNSGGSSEEVNGKARHKYVKFPIKHYSGKTLEPVAAAQAVGSSEGQGKTSVSNVAPSSQEGAASTSSQRVSGHPPGKRMQMVSGNHLLNFQYDPVPISRSQTRAPPPRRQQKRKPYNKDLFFQANYKFVVLDSGNYLPEYMDPDKMFRWEDIICLKYSTPFPVQCPICLDDPLCPQITSCGHIFCFPCILQYFTLDEADLDGDYWKKCPLCFSMISSKDLYNIEIENVKQYHVGDEIEFVLLTRQKDSFRSSLKNNEINIDGEILDSFSKFTLTSDVELSVRQAMSYLDSWIARAESGLVDDIEKLPYVCAAMKQLERRKKLWNEHKVSGGIKDNRNSTGLAPTANAANANFGACEFVGGTISTRRNGKSSFSEKQTPFKAEHYSPQVAAFNGLLEDHELPSLYIHDDNKNALMLHKGVKDGEGGDPYNFYQAIDGQHLILHPLNMKCLLHHYSSYDRLPNRITGKILQLEAVTQSEAMRRRYRFLSHFSLTTMFQLCEIDMSDVLPAEAFIPFIDEIKNREKQRKRIARKEHMDKLKAEIADSQFMPVPYYPHEGSPSFSVNDFEALGSGAVTVASSSPPTMGERQSFSSVARLGFAAAHDSPALKTDDIQTPPEIDVKHGSATTTGLRNAGTPSFANVASREKPVEGQPSMTKTNEVGKKGKKPTRVLLSTAGGRRY